MNLPTREEAKEFIRKIEIIQKVKNSISSDNSDNSEWLEIIKAYANGSLIEAKTEGEIEKILCETELVMPNGETKYKFGDMMGGDESRRLAHALVGKV